MFSLTTFKGDGHIFPSIISSMWYTAHVGFQMLTFLGRLLCWSKLSSDILEPLLQLLLLFSHLLIFWLPWKFLVWNTTPNLITKNMKHTFQPNDHTQDQPSSRSFSTPTLYKVLPWKMQWWFGRMLETLPPFHTKSCRKHCDICSHSQNQNA